jgi:alpha-galactosidase
MAAPLIFSGDMNYLDDFTLNVLCNSEVIDVDQDVLGKQGRIVRHTDAEFVLARPMADGSLAVGFFNLSNGQRNVAATLSELGLAGGCRVRDLWRQRDTGDCNGQYTAPVKAPLGISRPPVSSGR